MLITFKPVKMQMKNKNFVKSIVASVDNLWLLVSQTPTYWPKPGAAVVISCGQL